MTSLTSSLILVSFVLPKSLMRRNRVCGTTKQKSGLGESGERSKRSLFCYRFLRRLKTMNNLAI
jgi:hypothetical protein